MEREGEMERGKEREAEGERNAELRGAMPEKITAGKREVWRQGR